MSLSSLPLSYCTNVHPGRSVAEVEAGLDRYTVNVARNFGQPLAAGLWLAEPVIRELQSTKDGVVRFAEGLRRRGLTCHTLNAFPYGDFHSERVKEKVYLPDWAQPQRLAYTEQCAGVLAELLSDGVEGSISTVPLGFKGFTHPPDFTARCGEQLIELARRLAALRDRTGKVVRLAIEPEPMCMLETTPEAIAFFQQLWKQAESVGALDAVRTHLGLCFDVCHQAVEFEDVAEAIRSLDRTGVRINKVHISCAIQVDQPMQDAEALAALQRYAEPRYLHQTFAKTADGRTVKMIDLTEKFLAHPPNEFARASRWRVHFHVPVNAEQLGPLGTTRPFLTEAFGAVALLSYPPHLEVETYTWEVMPGASPTDLVDGLTREMVATSELIDRVKG